MRKTGYRIRRARGFTLAEILITLVIVGFIGALGVPMLGQSKLKQPVQLKQNHGTMECFYIGNTLYQYEANNSDNAEGDLREATGGACYFEAPRANLFVVLATNAGGDGAVGEKQPSYYEYQMPQTNASITTGNGFLSQISSAPEWVQEGWNQWAAGHPVTYTVTSPVGAGGASACEARIKSTDSCLEACGVLTNAAACPKMCREDLEANGGNSAPGNIYKAEAYLYYYPPEEEEGTVEGGEGTPSAGEGEGAESEPNDDYKDSHTQITDPGAGGSIWVPNEGLGADGNVDVKYTLSYSEATLTVGERRLSAKATMAGEAATIGYEGGSGSVSNGIAKKGKDGEGCVGGVCVEATNISFEANEGGGKTNKGAIGCDNPNAEPADIGRITSNPSSVSCTADVWGIHADYGLAGKAGKSEMRILEKLTPGMMMKFVPAKNINEETVVYIKTPGSGEWSEYLRVSLYRQSGEEMVRDTNYSWPSQMTSGSFYVESGDLPFPAVYFPESFRPQLPNTVMTSGLGYRSELAARGISPGAGGAGAHPYVSHISGTGTYSIGGVSVGYHSMPSIGAWGSCFDGKQPVNGKCGQINTPGTPGGVVITW